MKWKAAAIAIFVGVVVSIPWATLRVRALEDSFGKVKVNDSRESVLRAMGHPWKDEGCGRWLGNKPDGCDEEFVYAYPFAPYPPEYWVVWFSANHHVIDLYHTVSP